LKPKFQELEDLVNQIQPLEKEKKVCDAIAQSVIIY